MLKAAIEEALMMVEVTIKKLVRTDLVAAARLAALQGNVLCVELTSPQLTFYVLPVAEGLEFSFRPQQANCTLRGSWVDMLAVAEDEHRLFRSNVSIEGDHSWVLALKVALADLDVDWESLLAEAIGDLPAHQLAQGLRSAKQYASETSALLRQDISDYLHEELRLLPSHYELQAFYEGVDELRLAVDRVTARISSLEAQKQTAQENGNK